jgi:hypothetical protein
MIIFKQVQALVLSLSLVVSAVAPTNAVSSAIAAEPQNQQTFQTASTTASSAPSPQELQQLVAPIALYPDALVAQVLAGATYPTQIVEAERWLQQNKNLKGDQFVAAVDQQSWDPSIKALSQFPSVVSNMNQNLSWTSSLGDAYFNDPSGVMNAIQALRKDAQNAGNLKSTPEQTVTTEDQTIIIQPSNPEVVYVPTYSQAVYGVPMEAYPGYSGWDVAAASVVSFGVGMAVGSAFHNNWGWGGWGCNWHGGSVMYNRNTYVSRSNTFTNRNTRYNQAYRRTNANENLANRSNRAGNLDNRSFNRPSSAIDQNRPTNRPGSTFNQGNLANREHQYLAASKGFGNADRSSAGATSGAFGGFSQGGSARVNSARGQSSFSGRSSFSGGGGGSRGGGGGGRGGGRR